MVKKRFRKADIATLRRKLNHMKDVEACMLRIFGKASWALDRGDNMRVIAALERVLAQIESEVK